MCREHFITGFPSIRVFRRAHDDIYIGVRAGGLNWEPVLLGELKSDCMFISKLWPCDQQSCSLSSAGCSLATSRSVEKSRLAAWAGHAWAVCSDEIAVHHTARLAATGMKWQCMLVKV